MRPIVRRSPSARAYRCSVPATTSSSEPCMAELCRRKRRFVVSLSSVFVLALAGAPQGQTPWLEAYREPTRRIIDESHRSTFAWDRLAELGDTFGNRLSGSENFDAAIKWAADQMR